MSPKTATSLCHFLPLLPPITRNVKLPIPANPLQFSLRPRSARDILSKSGKNGNVNQSSQLYRVGTLRQRRQIGLFWFAVIALVNLRRGLPPAFMPAGQRTTPPPRDGSNIRLTPKHDRAAAASHIIASREHARHRRREPRTTS